MHEQRESATGLGSLLVGKDVLCVIFLTRPTSHHTRTQYLRILPCSSLCHKSNPRNHVKETRAHVSEISHRGSKQNVRSLSGCTRGRLLVAHACRTAAADRMRAHPDDLYTRCVERRGGKRGISSRYLPPAPSALLLPLLQVL